MGRCFKGRFKDDTAAMLGLKRCHGGTKIGNVLWKPCRYLERCLGMSVKKWKKLTEDSRQRLIAERNFNL